MTSLQKYNEASKWNRDQAHERLELLKRWWGFRGKNARKKTKLEFAKKEGISLSRLNRYLRLFALYGFDGLLSGHGKKGPRCLSKDQQDFIVGLIYKNPKIRAVRVWEYLNDKFGPGPSKSTVERFMRWWKTENKQLYDYLKNPNAWRSKYQISQGNASENITRFCQRLELDSTPADIICSDEKRYTCVGAIDVFSRKAKVLLADVSKSAAIAALLRDCICSWGIPEIIVKDHGRDYASKYIEAICATLKMKVPFIPPYRPDLKPFIERFWQTLGYGLFEELPGFIGHSVSDREAIRAQERFAKQFLKRGETVKIKLAKDELQEIIDKWISDKYEQVVHSGINARPAERAAASMNAVRRVSDERILDLLLARWGKATIQKKGIMYQGGFYQAVDLYQYIGEQIEIREDLRDAGRIYIFDKNGQFLFVATDKALTGFTPENYREMRKKQNQMIRQRVKALEQLTEVPEYPMLAHLERRESAPGKIISFIRQKEAEIPAAKEALKAVEARDEIGSREEPITEIPDEEGFFYGHDHRIRRYEHLMEKYRLGKTLTNPEREFIQDFEQSDEFYLTISSAEGGSK